MNNVLNYIFKSLSKNETEIKSVRKGLYNLAFFTGGALAVYYVAINDLKRRVTVLEKGPDICKDEEEPTK
jgi:hypothetical protein